jgi:molybdate transport system ATP-binding protein
VAFTNEAGITALFGRSGSGKTTTINVIAGLIAPDRGRIVLDGRVLVDTEAGISVPKHRRRVGLVFQDAQLFPHMTVEQNLMFGRWFAPPEERVIAFAPVVETLGIAHLLDRRPAELSGGERQRTAIGRALLASPRILLLDEPLASLDQARKREILPLIETLAAEFRIPVIYVSHVVEEVTRLANRVVVLEAGRVVAIGAPEEVIASHSRSSEGDRFALASVISGRLGACDRVHALTPLHHPAGTVFLSGDVGAEGKESRIVIRATDVALATQRPRSLSIRNVLEGNVTGIVLDDGPVATVEISLKGHGRLLSTVTRRAIEELGLGEGDHVYALIKTVALDERPVGVRPPGDSQQ